MKRHVGPLLKLLLLLAFLSSIDFTFGQAKTGSLVKYNSQILPSLKETREVNTANNPQPTGNLAQSGSNNIAGSSTLGEEIGFERLELQASPKAFSSTTNLSFVLKQEGNYKLEVLDMRGVVVAVLAEGVGQAGDNLVFPFKKERNYSGAYIGRLITKDEVTSVRFILK